jgi:threonine/homoserine/homoserine lactone efflux protein
MAAVRMEAGGSISRNRPGVVCSSCAAEPEASFMTLDLFTDLLLASLVVALSPIVLIAVTLVLGTARGRTNGSLFTAGWLLGVLLITVVFTALSETAEQGAAETTTLVHALKLGVGVLLLALAARKLVKRRKAAGDAPAPAWMQKIGETSPRGAFILGFTLAAANPKNLAFAAVAAIAIAYSGVTGSAEWLAVILFVLLCSWTVLGALLAVLAAPTRAEVALARVRAFMERHNLLIMALLYAFFGVNLALDGLRGLLG